MRRHAFFVLTVKTSSTSLATLSIRIQKEVTDGLCSAGVMFSGQDTYQITYIEAYQRGI